MAVSNTETVTAQDFKVWMGGRRGACRGTYDQDVEVTGAAGGGTATLAARWVGNEWGFVPIMVIMAVTVQANTDPGFVRVSYVDTGNRRLQGELTYAYDTVVVDGNHITPEYAFPKVPIEPRDGPSVDLFMRAVFDTNTDTKIYHMHIFGLVFDAEWMSRSGDYRELIQAIS